MPTTTADGGIGKTARIGVIGGGAWGTALAQMQKLAGRDVLLWAREAAVVDDINQRHANPSYLGGVPLHPELRATGALEEVSGRDLLLMVTPAQHVEAVAKAMAPFVGDGRTIVICAKGMEQASGMLMSEVLARVLPTAVPAVLSGPSFAVDVVLGRPVAVTLATTDVGHAQRLAANLGTHRFRIYWTDDLVGVQLGGAVKNVLAIAAGIVDGCGLGASAHAALVTRGFAELSRFGRALGAQPETLTGLSGLGDLLLTCGSAQSRNMSLGRALGEGQALSEVLNSRRSVAEGVYTAAAVVQRAREKGLEMPIAEAVHAIIEGETSVAAAIEALLSRPLRSEA